MNERADGTSPQETTAVVFVHGLWMTGLESFALRHHVVHQQGWQWRTFHYHSVVQSQADVAAELDQTVRRLDAERVHLVGHSLGGLVIHRAMANEAHWPPGRSSTSVSPRTKRPARSGRTASGRPTPTMSQTP